MALNGIHSDKLYAEMFSPAKLCFRKLHMAFYRQQECIPVGCVPAARRPYAGVCFPGGSALGGCLVRGGGAWSGGVPGPGGVCTQGGLCSEGVGIPACTEADTPPPLWTDTRLWKYYLGPTSLRPVIIHQKRLLRFRAVHSLLWILTIFLLSWKSSSLPRYAVCCCNSHR